MVVNIYKKNEFWNHFLAKEFLKRTYPKITPSKLREVKSNIFSWEFFWEDVVVRHNGLHWTPETMEEKDKTTYDHCQGNFWGMIHEVLLRKGLIK